MKVQVRGAKPLQFRHARMCRIAQWLEFCIISNAGHSVRVSNSWLVHRILGRNAGGYRAAALNAQGDFRQSLVLGQFGPAIGFPVCRSCPGFYLLFPGAAIRSFHSCSLQMKLSCAGSPGDWEWSSPLQASRTSPDTRNMIRVLDSLRNYRNRTAARLAAIEE